MIMAEIHIGDATPPDREAVMELLTAQGLPLDGLADHFDTAIVARQGSRIVGSAALEMYDDGALLRSVAVDPSVRSTGLGRRLTDAALDRARARHAPAVYLLTTTAEGFFPRFGFTRIAREDVPESVKRSVEFRSACPASAVVMRKVLSYLD
jgi:amino-acid N-acetyltransferase